MCRSCPEETYIAKLSMDHAYLVSKHWKLFEPDNCLQYLKYVFEKSISVGLFLKSDPSQPVSWTFLSSFGNISGVHTLKEHRMEGYSRVVTLCLMEKVLEANLMPFGAINVHNPIDLSKGVGLVEAPDSVYHIHKVKSNCT